MAARSPRRTSLCAGPLRHAPCNFQADEGNQNNVRFCKESVMKILSPQSFMALSTMRCGPVPAGPFAVRLRRAPRDALLHPGRRALAMTLLTAYPLGAKLIRSLSTERSRPRSPCSSWRRPGCSTSMRCPRRGASISCRVWPSAWSGSRDRLPFCLRHDDGQRSLPAGTRVVLLRSVSVPRNRRAGGGSGASAARLCSRRRAGRGWREKGRRGGA